MRLLEKNSQKTLRYMRKLVPFLHLNNASTDHIQTIVKKHYMRIVTRHHTAIKKS